MKTEVLKEIVCKNADDVRYPYGELLERVGFDALFVFLEEFGGLNVYIPTARTVFYDCIMKQLRTEFTGGNYRELCRKFGFAETTIRKYLRSHNAKH